jgi:uncharacterized membrane-anchored protein YitT (DUF2179 family)
MPRLSQELKENWISKWKLFAVRYINAPFKLLSYVLLTSERKSYTYFMGIMFFSGSMH